jgi:DNA-binding HxlR family transcriptional regulator
VKAAQLSPSPSSASPSTVSPSSRPPSLEPVDLPEAACRSFQVSLELVGKRWTGAILLAGLRGATRFSEFTAMVPGISDRLLSQRLKELEADHLIQREVVPSTPVQVRYRLTAQGVELMNSLQPLIDWGHKWIPQPQT